jgi:hypothetical protein
MKIVYKKYCFPHSKHGYITTPDIIIWYIWLAFDILAISYQIVAVSTINLILMNLECKICVGEICFIMLITQDEVNHLHNYTSRFITIGKYIVSLKLHKNDNRTPYSITLPTFGQLICINFLQEIMCCISWKILSLHQSVLQKKILHINVNNNKFCKRRDEQIKIYFTYISSFLWSTMNMKKNCSAQLDYVK